MKYYWVHYWLVDVVQNPQPFSQATKLHPAAWLESRMESLRFNNTPTSVVLASWQEITKAEYEAFNQ